ncbi:hypothetical protein TRAPUB_12151 [Trametes pubescens]|uniref:Aminoglycoside phosphotransferase domain-containing protein n=1 Tax=Trametes pubescens TaxID=154538 RepID=A0A1M2VUR7_TRAPU|nr:hypothetical protein TRAPUB_12151 [Trametes pubescens]
MAAMVTLEEVKALLRYSANLKPKPVCTNLNPVPTGPEPYTLPQGGTGHAVRAIVKGDTPMVVKFGLEVYAREAEVMNYVASRTSIPMPRIYGVFTEAVGQSGSAMTYIVQEHVPGMRLEHAFESLSGSERDATARQLKDILTQLRGLTDGQTRLQPFGGGSWARTFWFKNFQRNFPISDEDARTTRSFLEYFTKIKSRSIQGCDWTPDEFLSFFDLDCAPIFSYGDITPWNIMVYNGRISGVVDWVEAGWYPYFWDSFVLERAADRFWQIKGVDAMLRAALLEFFPEGDKFAIHWGVQWDNYW